MMHTYKELWQGALDSVGKNHTVLDFEYSGSAVEKPYSWILAFQSEHWPLSHSFAVVSLIGPA